MTISPANACSPIEITSDLSTVKSVISELIKTLNSDRKSREISLLVTKLQEARMWAEESQRQC